MTEQFWMALLILAFGVCCLCTLYLVMRFKKELTGWGEYSTRILILILVVIVGGSLVSSPVPAEKTGQLLSLFGVIVGYLLTSWAKKGNNRPR